MQEIIVVTGLPRSGTSLMMQLLKEAGLPILCDDVRESDESNPKGYFELEAVKGIVKDNSFLNDAGGKVVKVVAPLPMFLNPNLSYQAVFMRRDMEEVLRSQEVMLNKNQTEERAKFAMMYDMHIKKTIKFFKENDFPFLEVDYNELVSDPKPVLINLVDFLNLNASVDSLLEIIDPQLYRNQNAR